MAKVNIFIKNNGSKLTLESLFIGGINAVL